MLEIPLLYYVTVNSYCLYLFYSISLLYLLILRLPTLLNIHLWLPPIQDVKQILCLLIIGALIGTQGADQSKTNGPSSQMSIPY